MEIANKQIKIYKLSHSINAREKIKAVEEDRECWGGSEVTILKRVLKESLT